MVSEAEGPESVCVYVCVYVLEGVKWDCVEGLRCRGCTETLSIFTLFFFLW